jgi:hypothetical protein
MGIGNWVSISQLTIRAALLIGIRSVESGWFDYCWVGSPEVSEGQVRLEHDSAFG